MAMEGLRVVLVCYSEPEHPCTPGGARLLTFPVWQVLVYYSGFLLATGRTRGGHEEILALEAVRGAEPSL